MSQQRFAEGRWLGGTVATRALCLGGADSVTARRGGHPDLGLPCLRRNFPIRGVQFYDGPINIQNCTFRKFAALEGRHTSALAFRLNNAWQSCPHNNVTSIVFEDVPVREVPGQGPGKPRLGSESQVPRAGA